jgi:CheY-like chemotaxis protein
MQRYSILWADDEIDLLTPHIIFLSQRGYDITPVNNGAEAVELSEEKNFDVVFLDENMPGLSGLEALSQIKNHKPNLPVVMITKNEEEQIMEEAIGSKIADYLIKPINSSQILSSIKKILDNKRLVTEKTNLNYQQEFRKISMAFQDVMNHEQWADIYKKMIYWELEMDNSHDMDDILDAQKIEANASFSKFVMRNYESWLNDAKADKPLLSHQIMKRKVFPELGKGKPVFVIVIDNLRFDQWKVLEPIVREYFVVDKEEHYYSILPTTTAYARNAIFSGQLPAEMAKTSPDLWVGEDEEESRGKNNSEDEFLNRQLRRNNLQAKMSYHKIKNQEEGRNLADTVHNLFKNDLNVIVYNFVDMLSHARTDMAMVRELAPDESAYRSITRSWFQHSPLLDVLKKMADKDVRVVLTTDHGTIRVKRPFRIIGDRNVNTNLRYKQGKNLGYEGGKLMVASKPERLFLPKVNVSTSYVFAIEDQFFAYPNNYNQYVNLYKDTFQHGGVSMEEMIIPLIFLNSKNVVG